MMARSIKTENVANDIIAIVAISDGVDVDDVDALTLSCFLSGLSIDRSAEFIGSPLHQNGY